MSQESDEKKINDKNNILKRQISADDEEYKLTTVNLNKLNNNNNDITLDSINDSNFLNTTPLNTTNNNIIRNDSFCSTKQLAGTTFEEASSSSLPSLIVSSTKKKKVVFKDVNLYLFDRTQGFQSIPSDTYQTSITLGMNYKHSHIEKFETLDDYFKFKRRVHLNKLEKELNQVTNENEELDNEDKDYINKINEILNKKNVYENDINIDLPISSDVFCPILSPNERINKLAEFGYSTSDLDLTESNEILDIKQARIVNVGCKCKQMNMVCGENGIQCQLDKTRFPCECTLKKCKNPNGIKRFDQKTVVKHRMTVLSNQNNDVKSNFTKNEIDQSTDSPLLGSSIVATPDIKRKRRKRNSGSYPDYSKRRKKPNVKSVNSPSTKKNADKTIIVGNNISITTSNLNSNDLNSKTNQTEPIKQIDVNIMKN